MRTVVAALALGALPSAALAGPCIQWRAPEEVGALETTMLREASGLAASRAYPGRLYLNNDSGDGPYFYVREPQRGETARVGVSGFSARDVESIALGPCTGSASCVWLGDIGDNARTRETVTFAAVSESEAFAAEAIPAQTISARYPDGPHDAEAFAFHPNGDLYLITKTMQVASRTSGPAGIYRLPAAALASGDGGVLTFETVGAIDLPALINDFFPNQVATAMDISADGERVAILTYRNLLEWSEDLSDGIETGSSLQPGSDYTLTPIAPLVQAEALAYLPDDMGVIYTSEVSGSATEAPLYKQTCARRD